MAKYTDAQLDQFMKDNEEVLSLASDAGIGLDQLSDGALNMSAFDPSWGETIKAGGKAAVAGFKKQGLGLGRAFAEGAIEEPKERSLAENVAGVTVGEQVVSDLKTLARGFLGKEKLKEISDKLATEDANVSKKLSDEMPYIDDPDSLKATTIDAIGGVLPTAVTGLATGLLTRNPTAAAAAVGAGSYGTYYGDSRDKGLTPEQSRERAERFALLEGASEAVPFAAAMGKLGGKGILSTIGKTAVSEGAQEGATEIAQALHDSAAYGEEIPEDLMQRAWRSAKAGALGGGFMGAGGHVLNFNPKVENQSPEATGAVNKDSIDLGSFDNGGVTEEIITPEQDVIISDEPIEHVEMDGTEQIEEPDLSPVIDTEPEQIPQEQIHEQEIEQESGPVESGTELIGKEHKVYTPDNEPVDTNVKIVEADDLVASHDIEGKENPNYPQELQQRDRSKSSLVNRVKNISDNLNPERLDLSADIASGAPVVNGQVVESGNGRTIAVKDAYHRGKGEGYKEYLVKNAEKYGLNPDDIATMKNPVLVLQRNNELKGKELQDFTKKANQDIGVKMSPVERAKSDSELLSDDDLLDISIGDNGDMTAASNHKFITKFAGKLGDEEAAGYMTSENRWNTEIGKRALAAVFQKAYGDQDLTTNVFEDVSQDTKRVMSSLARAAGHIAKLKAYDGGDLGLGSAVAEAANIVRSAGKKGQSTEEYISQLDMLNQPSPVALDLAEMMAVNSTSTKRMGDVLVSLAKQIESEHKGSMSGDLFDGDGTPPLNELMKANEDHKRAKTRESKQETGDLFTAAASSQKQTKKSSENSKQQKPKRTEAKDTGKLGSELASRNDAIDAAANEAATSPANNTPEPTQAQKEAGNYKHGHVKVSGVDIAIENPKGSQRSGVDENGDAWSVEMKNHYGRIKKTEGADGDQVDVFIGPKPNSQRVFVVNQNNPKTGKFDEHKVMMGFETEQKAVEAYKSNYSKDWKGFGDAVEMDLGEFKSWLKDSDTTKPAVSEFKNAISSIKSGKEMNAWIERNTKNPVFKEIASRISSIISDNLEIVPVKKGDYAPVSMRRSYGVYSRQGGRERIFLWNDKDQNKNADELTVMHELVHAATASSVRKGTLNPDSALGHHVKDLDNLRIDVINNIRSRRINNNLTSLEKSNAGKNVINLALSNVDEFIAWSMTDKNAQEILKNIEVQPKETAWSKFVVSLAKILGIKPSSTNALAQLIETTDKIMSVAEVDATSERIKLSQGSGAIRGIGGVSEQDAEKVRNKFNPEPKLAPHQEIIKKAKAAKDSGAKSLVSSVKSEIRRGMIDKYEPIKKLEDQMYADGTLTDVTSSAWRMANTIHAAHGVMSVLFDYGKVKYDPVQKVIVPATKNEGGLKKVLSQLNEPNELGDFFMWIASNRANEINARSKAAQAEIESVRAEKKNLKDMLAETSNKAIHARLLKGIRDADSKINELKRKAEVQERFLDEDTIRNGMLLDTMPRKNGSSREALFDKVLTEFNEYRESVLRVAEATGIITSENREMWSDQFYVPFYRVMENDTKMGPHPTPGLSRQDAIKKLKGSQKQLGDLFDNTLMNFNFLIDASLRNRAAFQAIENAKLTGIAEQTTEHLKSEQSTYVMEDGKKVWYNISDPAYFAAVTATGMTKMPFHDNPIMKLANKSKVAFTKLTTIVPKFSIAMIVKDAVLAPAIGKVGMAKGGAIRGAYRYGMGGISDAKAEMLTTGASFDLGYDAQDRKKKLDKEFKQYSGKVVPIQHALGALKGMANYYGDFQNMAENANRAAIFIAAKEDGKSDLEAAFESADMQNFSQSGAWSTIRFLNGIVPFLNVGLQGIDKTARSFGNVFKAVNGMADQETKAKAVRFATVAAALSTATIALALQNADDDEYRELPEYMKNTYWFLRFGDRKGEYFLIPKPFTIGSVINLSEKITDNITGVSKAKGTLDYVRKVALDVININPIPQLAKPWVELYMNKNMFTGQPIENQRDLRYSPAERYDYKTSELAKFFGNDKLSPKQIDHLLKAYFSSGGEVISEGINLTVNAYSDNPRPAKYWYERSVFTRFYSDRTAPTFTKSQQRFYDVYNEFIQAKNDYKRAAEMGDRAKVEKILKAKGYKIQLAPMLDKYKRKIGKITKEVEATRNNKLLSPEDKRKRIDMLNAAKANMYQQVMHKVDTVTEEIDKR